MKSFAAASALLAASTQVSAKGNTETLTEIEQDFAMVRGTIEGFQRGIYNQRTYEISDKCLGETTTNAIAQLMNPTKSHDPNAETSVFYETLTSVYNILAHNDRYCDIEGIFIDLYEYCFVETDECAFELITARAQKDVFGLIAKVNDVAMRASEDKPEDLQEYQDYFATYG